VSVTHEELQAAAIRLIRHQVRDFEPFSVFENEAFDHYSDDERELLVDLVFDAKVAVTWGPAE
jgi:hypothetical protein